MDPFVFLYCLEAISHVARMPRIPQVTGSVVGITLVLHALRDFQSRISSGSGSSTQQQRRSGALLSIYDYGLVPEWTFRRCGLTASMLVSPFLHTSVAQLATHLLPFLMTGCTLENVTTSRKTYLLLLAYAIVIPNTCIVILTKMMGALPWTVLKRRSTRHYDFQSMIPYARRIHCGLSPVLFCVQTILNLNVLSPNNISVNMYGVAMSARWSHWMELLLHQYLMPGGGSSIFSRLSGILAGYLYVEIWRNRRWRTVLLEGNWTNRNSSSSVFHGWWRWVRRRGDVWWQRLRGGRQFGENNVVQLVEEGEEGVRERNMVPTTLPTRTNVSVEELRRRRLLRFNSAMHTR